MSEPRGIRNNNPLNIRHGHAWVGETSRPKDPAFESYMHVIYGLRAAVKILRSYARRGLITVEQCIAAWAPPEDNNDTDGYLRFVCQRAHVRADDALLGHPRLAEVLKAMVQMENGTQPYPDSYFELAIDLALNETR